MTEGTEKPYQPMTAEELLNNLRFQKFELVIAPYMYPGVVAADPTFMRLQQVYEKRGRPRVLDILTKDIELQRRRLIEGDDVTRDVLEQLEIEVS